MTNETARLLAENRRLRSTLDEAEVTATRAANAAAAEWIESHIYIGIDALIKHFRSLSEGGE